MSLWYCPACQDVRGPSPANVCPECGTAMSIAPQDSTGWTDETAFYAGGKGKGASYALVDIPQPLWRAFRRKCRTHAHPDGSTGVSLRARILTLISQDVGAERGADAP